MTELQQAIKSLYDVFARYPKPATISSCPCGCTKPEETAPLLAAPLAELASHDLTNYAFSAMSTQGDLSDFLYFVPRLFQGIVEDLNGLNPEILFGKLNYKRADWRTWPEPEAAAIRTYLLAFWKEALRCYPVQDCLPTFFEIETVLSCIARTGEPLEPYLKIWTEAKTVAASKHLIQFVTMWGDSFSNGQTLCDAFWEKSRPQGAELRDWLLCRNTMQRVEESAHLLKNDGWEDRFEPAFEILKNEAARHKFPLGETCADDLGSKIGRR